jgi:hypothetical protein
MAAVYLSILFASFIYIKKTNQKQQQQQKKRKHCVSPVISSHTSPSYPLFFDVLTFYFQKNIPFFCDVACRASNAFSLSMFAKGKVFHFKIGRTNEGYYLGVKGTYNSQRFPSLIELVEFGSTEGNGLPALLLIP